MKRIAATASVITIARHGDTFDMIRANVDGTPGVRVLMTFGFSELPSELRNLDKWIRRRLRAVLRRVQALPSPAAAQRDLVVGPLHIAPAQRECWLGEEALSPTGTEFDMLVQLAQRPGDVVSKDELSERVLRRPREPYDRSVDVHISNLRQKLVAAGGGVEIETVRAIGYRLRPPA